MKINFNRRTVFMFFTLFVCFLIILSLQSTYGTTDQMIINNLTWKTNPYWVNSTSMSITTVGATYFYPYNINFVNTNLSNILDSDIYSYKYVYVLRRHSTGYYDEPDSIYINGSVITEIGAYFYSSSSTSSIKSYINYFTGGTAYNLAYDIDYDISQIVLFNNTVSTITSNLLIYTSGHLDDNNYLLSNYSYSYNSAGNTLFGYGNFTYVKSSTILATISNQKMYLVNDTSYTPPPANSGGIDITQVPTQLASRLGISVFAAGILATLVLLLFAELPLMIFASENIILMTIFGIVILSIGVALGWLPYWVLIIVVVLTALLFADVFRKYLTGSR